MRSFIAIEFPPEIIKKLHKVSKYFKSQTPEKSLKWVEPENLHLTLKFLGEIAADQLDEVKAALISSLKDQPSFEIEIKGMGMYPNPRHPRVIWLGISGENGIKKVHAIIDRELAPLGFEPERRGFSPHLTLARVRPQTDRDTVEKIGTTLSQFNVDSLGKVSVENIHLFQSKLTPQGPIYTRLLSVPLHQV